MTTTDLPNRPKGHPKFTVTLVGDDTVHEVQTTHRDLMMTETALAKRGMDATGQKQPVHYVTALIWSAMVRLGLTAVKFDEFGDFLDDYDRVKTGSDEVAGDVDPTRPGDPTG